MTSIFYQGSFFSEMPQLSLVMRKAHWAFKKVWFPFFSFLSSVAAAHPFSVAFTNRWQFPTHDSTTVGAKPVSSIYPSSMHLLIGPFSASKYLVCGDERIGLL